MPLQLLPKINKPALIIVDMQNDFIRQGAPFEVPGGRETIAPQQRLLQHFRDKGYPVIFLQWVSVENDAWRRLESKFSWTSFLDEQTKACRVGHLRRYEDSEAEVDCAGIIAELAPIDGEIIVQKHGFGGFYGTTLQQHLSELGVDTLVVTGVVAECCVEDTVREALYHHYTSIVVSDAVESMSPSRKIECLAVLDENYGWVAESGEVIDYLSSASAY